MRLLKRLSDWWVGRDIKAAERNGDTSRLAELLDGRPELRDDFIERARTASGQGDAWIGMLYCLALARRNDLKAFELLSPLLSEHDHDGLWRDLDEDEALALAQFVKGHRPELYDKLLNVCHDDCFEAIGIELEDKSELWLRLALKRDRFWLEASDRLTNLAASGPQEFTPPMAQSAPALKAHLTELQTECHQLMQGGLICGYPEEVVRRINVVSAAIGQPVDSELLSILAKKIEYFRPLGLVSLAQLFYRNAAPQWVPALRRAWLRMDELVRREGEGVDKFGGRIDSDLELAAYEVTAALGACSAQDQIYRDFAADDALTEDLKELEQQRHELVKQHNRIVGELFPEHDRPNPYGSFVPSGEAVFNTLSPSQQDRYRAAIHELSRQIQRLDVRLESRHREVREHYSAGFILRRILADGQRYSVSVRQGAAWGIYSLCTKGHLTGECRDELQKLLRSVIHDKSSREFRERRLYMLPDSTQMEMVQTLRDGLQWMLTIVENPELSPLPDEEVQQEKDELAETADSQPDLDDQGSEVPQGAGFDTEPTMPAAAETPLEDAPRAAVPPVAETIDDYDHLESIVRLLWEKLPHAIAFFQEHPLRLMRLDDHKAILGLYAENGCELQYWTRYQPPKNVGKVEIRYLEIDDRTTPNSMGIFYRLFRHPLLAVPVLYHEYLHYAGVDDRPGEGIKNEMEVRLREIVFTRSLLAELAPASDDLIPRFESELAEVVEAVELPSLLFELLEDFENDDRLALYNQHIVSTYGHQLEDDQAAYKAAQLIEHENRSIHVSNFRLTWDPQVQWPLLDTGATQELTERYQRLLSERWRQVHWIDPGERDAILAERHSTTARRQWDAYKCRTHATEVIHAACKAHAVDLQEEQIVQLIARRFNYPSPGDMPAELLELLRRAIQEGDLNAGDGVETMMHTDNGATQVRDEDL